MIVPDLLLSLSLYKSKEKLKQIARNCLQYNTHTNNLEDINKFWGLL